MYIFIYSLSDAIQNNFGKIGYICAKKQDKNTYRKGDRKFNIGNTISEKMCILSNKKKRLLCR